MLSDNILYTRSPVKCREASVPVTNRQHRKPQRSPNLTQNPEGFSKNLEAFTASMFDDDADHSVHHKGDATARIGVTDEESMLSSIVPAHSLRDSMKQFEHQREMHTDESANDLVYNQESAPSDDLADFAHFLQKLPSKYRVANNQQKLYQLSGLSASEHTILVTKEVWHMTILSYLHM